MKKFVLYSLILCELLLTGCSSKNTLQYPKDIEEINEKKVNKRVQEIKIAKQDDKLFFQIYLSKDNKINYICTNTNCDYDDKSLDIVLMYPNHFYPSFSINKQNIQCGIGSMGGLFILSSKIDIENYSKKNQKICDNRFTKFDSAQVFTKVATSIVTLGTSLITSGTMHTVKFDSSSFKDAIIESNLDYYQKILFDISNINTIKSGFDVIYLNNSNMKKHLVNYYEKLLQSKHTRDGLIIIDENSNQIISIIDFRKYNSNDIMKNIADEIQDIFINLTLKESELFLKESDILKWIPKEIAKPKLPILPTLNKDEFETKEEFKNRVLDAVLKREEIIKALQKQYNLNILKRNEYIFTLEKAYNNYLKDIYDENSRIQNSLQDNLEVLVKILFIQNLNGIEAENFKYDAEKSRLYFEIYSKNNNLKNKALAFIPANIAKNIKENNSYYFEPILEYKKGFVSLRGFEIIDTNSENRYKVKNTNIEFSPISSSVIIQTNKEDIVNTETNKEFSKLKQTSSSIVDNQKEFWYIDLVDTINAKVPKWFSNPQDYDSIVSYASAPTYEEAKIKAINDLAISKEVKIKSEINAQNTFDNRLKVYSNLDKKIIANVEMTFKENEFKVLKQEKVEGIWYICLIYNN